MVVITLIAEKNKREKKKVNVKKNDRCIKNLFYANKSLKSEKKRNLKFMRNNNPKIILLNQVKRILQDIKLQR